MGIWDGAHLLPSHTKTGQAVKFLSHSHPLLESMPPQFTACVCELPSHLLASSSCTGHHMDEAPPFTSSYLPARIQKALVIELQVPVLARTYRHTHTVIGLN